MPEPTADFQSLPEEYLRLIHLAQEAHAIRVAPLQLLVGGWSGAFVYLVSVSHTDTGRVEHCILKLDRGGRAARSDELTRHNAAREKSAPVFAGAHIPELAFERVEHAGLIAIFYRIAGQSLLKYRPLSSYERQSQLSAIFEATHTVLLEEWNPGPAFEQAVHPQAVLESWLGFRLQAGGNIENFLRSTCGVDPQAAGLLVNGHVFPNPLLLARQREGWGDTRALDVAMGMIHGDLNTNNILVRFSEESERLEGYYLIDFALFKQGMPLLYDQRYLEMSYLAQSMARIAFAKCVDFLTSIAVADIPDPHKVPIEVSGVGAVIAAARQAFGAWVDRDHPSLHDDLWGQYWLAGAAAGLAYCHKDGQPDELRLAGLIYAAANLKRYALTFRLPLPSDAQLLYDESRSVVDSSGASAPRKPRHNLPAQATAFIGRSAHLAALKDMLLDPQVRLITLLGPGGTGKSRLSLQVAQETLERFAHGACFVPLADDTDANQLVSRVAQQLEVREGGRPLLENVKDYLRDKQLLLVLDNFEQLVTAAPVAAELLAAAPGLKILVSSRVALRLQGEREYPVPPLDLPNADPLAAAELAATESVQLFVERARAASPGFALTDENVRDVAEICRRLDGLPLALELAAARIKLLPPRAILARLDDRFKLLTGGARDLPARQRTLRDTLEWSCSLLSEPEQTLFARLGVFVGGFSFEAAEAVCNSDSRLDLLEGLTALADNSLLRREQVDGEPRFGMLETIRAYALERLAANGELESLRTQHAGYFGDVIANQMGFFQLYTSKALHWLDWLEQEHDNIRATLTWYLAAPQGVETAALLVNLLFWFWYRRGYSIEAGAWADRILASPSMQAPSPVRAMTLFASSSSSMWQGNQNTALEKVQQSLAILQASEDKQWLPFGLMGNAVVLINMGRDRAAQPLLEQALTAFQEQQIAPFEVISQVHLGNVELGLGNLEQARRYHEKALARARELDENWLIAFALNNLGEVARTRGQFDRARQYYEESEVLLRATGDQGDVARYVHSLGYIAQHEEDFELAESKFRESLAMFRRLGNRRGIAECLAGLAGLKAQQGHTKWGATLLGAAESLLKVTGGAWWPADRVEVERNRAMLRSALGAADFAAAWEAGEAFDLDQAIAFAADAP